MRFACKWRDASGQRSRRCGSEDQEFDGHGLMRRRIAGINDLPTGEAGREFHWPLGKRSDGHAGLSGPGL